LGMPRRGACGVGRVVIGIGGLRAPCLLCAISAEAGREIVTMKVRLVSTQMPRTYHSSALVRCGTPV